MTAMSHPNGAGAGDPRRSVAFVARRWWQRLQPIEHVQPGDPGALARLRRAAAPIAAVQEKAAIDLLLALGGGERDLERAALTASVLACVRTDDDDQAVPVQVATRRDGGPLLTPLRHKRLLEARTPLDCLQQFRRLVHLADARLNVGDLAWFVYGWTDPEHSKRRRTQWAYAFHGSSGGQAAAAPLSATNA